MSHSATNPSLKTASLLAAVFLFFTAPLQAAWLSYQDADADISLRVWANDGADKVTQEELRAFGSNVDATNNALWNGQTIHLVGARNEVVSFSVIVDNADAPLAAASVSFSQLSNGPYVLATTDHNVASLFDWRQRPIEVFTVNYLRVLGLSKIGYELYDETHIPSALRRPHSTAGQPTSAAVGVGDWTDRPNHDRSYPDIAVPQEVLGSTPIARANSQQFWVDVYLPKDAPSGVLSGDLELELDGASVLTVPVEIEVLHFSLPDERHSKTMLYTEASDVKERYFTGLNQPMAANQQQDFRDVVNRHYALAWRHGISLIDANELLPDSLVPTDQPNIDWQDRLAGNAYTDARGYDGPGKNLPHDLFSIGTYGAWSYWWNLREFHPLNPGYQPPASTTAFETAMRDNSDAWETWFQTNAPDAERFLYIEDEPFRIEDNGDVLIDTFAFAETAASFVANNPGPGSSLDTFVSANPVTHGDELGSVSILGTQISVGPTADWDIAISNNPQRGLVMYNGRRPASGTFMIDDEGVALRQLAWGQYKKGVERWFYWHSTYYNNYQGGAPSRVMSEVGPEGGEDFRLGSQTNVFKSAHTFGGHGAFDPVVGETGFNYGNGDGVLFYPGTDLVFPAQSLGLAGPMASLRLKHWRRGIQDVQYLALAASIDPVATQLVVDRMVPEVLWEVGVADPNDPTYVHKAPSWSIDPDDWEQARADLAAIILNDACPDDEFDDTDGDGVCSGTTYNSPSTAAEDNCTLYANPDQTDTDGDGYGNRCDADLNNDCKIDRRDLLLLRRFAGTGNLAADISGDGQIDRVDLLLLRRLAAAPIGPSAQTAQCATF